MPAIVTKVHGSRSVYARVCPRGPVWRRHIEQLRPRYGVEEDLDPGWASELMMPLEDLGLGGTPKEGGDSSSVEEPKSGADLEREIPQPDTDGQVVGNEIQGSQQGMSMDLTTLENPSDLRNHHHFNIGNRLVKRTSRLVERCCGVQVFQPLLG